MKIQLAVTILILYFFVLWFDSEFIFALMFNAGSVYWIATILFPPLLLKLSISRKIIWIALNYLFLNFSFVIFGFLPKLDLSKALYTLYSRDEDYRKENPNFEKDYFTNIGQAITPNEEYQNFKKLHPYNLYNPTKYVVVAHLKNDSLFIFASLYYSHFLEDTIVPFINKNLNPSLKGVKVPLKNVGAIFNNKIIPLKTFENIRTSFNSELAEYKENVDLFRKEALFDSNKNYFEMVYENINSFESMNSNDSIIRKIAKENPKLISTIPSDSSLFYCIVDLEPKYYPENTLQIEEMENKFFWRDFMTNLLMRIILTPAAIFHSLVNVFLN